MKKQVLKIKMVEMKIERRHLNLVTWQWIRWSGWWKAEEKVKEVFKSLGGEPAGATN